MARGRKTGGRDWTKGQSGNPAGQKPLPEDLKGAKSLNRVEAERLLNRYISMPTAELRARSEDDSLPALERLICTVVFRGIVEGDHQRLGFLFDRLIGKVKEAPQDHNFNFNFRSMPREKVIELGREAIKFLQSSEET